MHLLAKISVYLRRLLGFKPGATSESAKDVAIMPETRQGQVVADSSVAMQAGRDLAVYNGISYSDARQIALDVFRGSLTELAGHARAAAKERVEEITDALLQKLSAENPEGIGQAIQPGFQFALGTVQKEFARTGDKDLADLLVDLLVDRTKHPSRDIMQIVLDESLNTAPKLTDGQLANLALIFLFKYTVTRTVGNHDLLGQHFDKYVEPFTAKLVKSEASFQHLQFTGCGSESLGEASLERLIGTTYQGLFVKGFDEEALRDPWDTPGIVPNLFVRCINAREKVQVNVLNMDQLSAELKNKNASEADTNRINQLFESNRMSEDEIRDRCVEIRPYMAAVFEMWAASSMKNFTLTSVGIAIAHANIKRLSGEFADLSIWIN